LGRYLTKVPVRVTGRHTMMYEMFYILPTRYTDAEIAEIQTKVNGLIEKVGAKVIKEENLGRIRLAYPIKQMRHGSYILNYIEVDSVGEEWAESKVLIDLDKELRMTDEVMRHMIIQLPKGIPDRSFKLESYVAPLSEEEDEARRVKRAIATDPIKVSAPSEEAEPMVREEKTLSMEDLDKKLDEILEANPSDEA